MKKMMTGYVIPRLTEEKIEAKDGRLTKSLLTTGIPESFIFERLGDIDKDVYVNDFVNGGDLELNITGSGDIEMNRFENCPQLTAGITGSGDIKLEEQTYESGLCAL